MRRITGVGILLLIGIEAFALSGTVKDDKGAAVSGARVAFLSDTAIAQTTNANGEFTLNKSVALFRAGDGGLQDIVRPALRGDRIEFSLAVPVGSGSMTVFANDGTERARMPLGPLPAGDHQVRLPGLAPGLYVLRLDLDRASTLARLFHSAEGSLLMPSTSVTRTGARSEAGEGVARLRRSASAAAVDTLLVRKAGFATSKTPVTSYSQTGLAIVLRADTGGIPPLPPVTDYSADGPYTAIEERNVGPGNAYTIYRPETLGANGFLHAPIIYGHGINGQVTSFATFLKSVASHGFVIIGCNVLTGGRNSPQNTAAMNNGLNWLLEQNTVAGSKFQSKLAVHRASSMGYSIGGTAAVDIGGHPNLVTVVSIHGHTSTATLRGTLLQTTGTADGVGLPLQQETFTNSKVQTFLGTVTGADHGYITRNNGGVQRPAIVAWLRYWAYNDAGGRNYFYGNDCVMCKAPWENPQRKHWQ